MQVGIPIDTKLTINASFDVPIWFTFGDLRASSTSRCSSAAGVEYMLQPNLALTFKLKVGPDIGIGDFSSTNFALYALIGVAYKM